MNAPWKPGPAGSRDTFSAFICDDAALDVLRPVVIEMGWQPEKCAKGGLRNAIQSLSITASPNILMVDLSESGDPLNDINALAEVCEPGTVVIADTLFTATAAILQPITGYLLAREIGWPLTEGWILLSLALYVFTGLFWLPVEQLCALRAPVWADSKQSSSS